MDKYTKIIAVLISVFMVIGPLLADDSVNVELELEELSKMLDSSVLPAFACEIQECASVPALKVQPNALLTSLDKTEFLTILQNENLSYGLSSSFGIDDMFNIPEDKMDFSMALNLSLSF